MRRPLLCTGFVFLVAAFVVADSNLHIEDVGLHGYRSTPAAVRIIVRNPSSQTQSIHLRVTVQERSGDTSTVTTDLTLNGGEQRRLELPVLIPAGKNKIIADAATDSSSFGHDTYEAELRHANLVTILCNADTVCNTAQSQMEFSGSIEERADKNRQLTFDILDDPRDDWWAYSSSTTIVIARPVSNLTPAQREALEGYLRCGGRLILLETEIADPGFLSDYRRGPPAPTGERVGQGTLLRVSSLSANTLGDDFQGVNLTGALGQQNLPWLNSGGLDLMNRRFATVFDSPRLRWILLWLAAYILIIGVLNFAVLRRFRRLEFGWISVCALALLFAAGFYFSSASKRPKEFRLDNLATYYLDGQSPLAAANYNLRISAPNRRDVSLSIADPAVFIFSDFNESEPNSDIWTEMNRQSEPSSRHYDISLGPPRQVELSLLKWSFRDLKLKGLHKFPGTVHFIAPRRLRNDTGQRFSEAVYLDYSANLFYALPALTPGEEIQLDTITPIPIVTKDGNVVLPREVDYRKQTLAESVLTGALPVGRGQVFAGLSEGPALPVDLNIPHRQDPHSFIVVALGQP